MTKSFVRDMLIYLPTKVLPALTGLITTPILTRIFLPEEYGDWALALGVTDFLFAIAMSGIGTAALRFFPAYKAKDNLNGFFSNVLAMTAAVAGGIGILAAVGLALFRGRIDTALFPLLKISILIFAVNSFYTIFMEILRIQQKSGLFTRLNLTNYYGGLILGLVFVLAFGLRIEGLMYGTVLVQIFAIPLLIRATMRGVQVGANLLDSSSMAVIWAFAWPLAFGNTAFWALRLSDRFVIEFFRPGIEVGLYSAVYNISDRTINLVVTLFLMSLGPTVANSWENQGREKTEQLLTKLTRLFLLICLPITVGLTSLALPFITLLTGEAYHEGYRIVGFVAFSTFAWGLSRIACWGLILNNKTLRFAMNQLFAGALNIGLNILLVPVYGYAVAAVTTLGGYTLLLVLQAHASRDYLTWKLPLGTLFRVGGAGLLMGAAVFGANALDVGNTDLIPTLGKIALGASVYAAALWAFGEITAEEKSMAKRFLLKLTRREK
jgi:O-antigen/teichoic acid export membrane protein